MLWHCMFYKHHITFTTFYLERIIWGIQQVTTKNPEKMVLEKTLQGTVYDKTYIVYMGKFWTDAMNGTCRKTMHQVRMTDRNSNVFLFVQ